MCRIEVGSLRFTFPQGWTATKFDDWAYYRNQFIKIRQGLKAVDILAIEPAGPLWLIEVKDYRSCKRTKPISLKEEIASKALDTVSAILPAAINATQENEQTAARAALKAKTIGVVLHLETSSSPNYGLFYPPKQLADLKQELRRILKPIDPHVLVVDKDHLDWTIQWKVDFC